MKFAFILGLLAFSQITSAASNDNFSKMKAALLEEIATRRVDCVSELNTKGYNNDGIVNFKSFVENSTAEITIDYNVNRINFVVAPLPQSSAKLEIMLNNDFMKVESFIVRSFDNKVTRRRVGSILNPEYENIVDSMKTFELRCTLRD